MNEDGLTRVVYYETLTRRTVRGGARLPADVARQIVITMNRVSPLVRHSTEPIFEDESL